jgi:3-phenylpropionate/trans-cinnamate dioxygenase ferredoxin reductase component
VRCGDGSLIEADMVVAGIGLLPNVELAEAAGLTVDNGIVVDELCRTADPDITAVGDCTNHPNEILGKRLRLESVPNAVEQARTAAATLCGKSRPYRMVPWFWSYQYDLKLKSVGLCESYDRLVLRGSTEKRSFALFYLQADRIVAVDTVNRPQEFMVSKRLIGEKIPVKISILSDDTVQMKSLLPVT